MTIAEESELKWLQSLTIEQQAKEELKEEKYMFFFKKESFPEYNKIVNRARVTVRFCKVLGYDVYKYPQLDWNKVEESQYEDGSNCSDYVIPINSPYLTCFKECKVSVYKFGRPDEDFNFLMETRYSSETALQLINLCENYLAKGIEDYQGRLYRIRLKYSEFSAEDENEIDGMYIWRKDRWRATLYIDLDDRIIHLQFNYNKIVSNDRTDGKSHEKAENIIELERVP